MKNVLLMLLSIILMLNVIGTITLLPIIINICYILSFTLLLLYKKSTFGSMVNLLSLSLLSSLIVSNIFSLFVCFGISIMLIIEPYLKKEVWLYNERL